MTTTSLGEEVAHVERELAELARAIAALYDRPVVAAAGHLTRQREREDLEVRLDAARARLLGLHLARTAEEYTGLVVELEAGQAELSAAEAALREAQQRATALRGRVEELRVRERALREQRQNLRQRLAGWGPTEGSRDRRDHATSSVAREEPPTPPGALSALPEVLSAAPEEMSMPEAMPEAPPRPLNGHLAS